MRETFAESVELFAAFVLRIQTGSLQEQTAVILLPRLALFLYVMTPKP